MKRTGYEIPVSHQRGAPYAGTQAKAPKLAFKSEILDKLHHYANIADDKLSRIGAPLNPYLAAIGRVLVVSTFIEDSWRILTNWNSQVKFIWQGRGFPWIVAELFFILNVGFMAAGSLCVVKKRNLLFGVSSLVGVLVSQILVYGLWDFQALGRAVSLIGGLLLVVSEVFVQQKRWLPGLPELDSKDRSEKVILVGRSLIVVLFLSHILRSSWTKTSIFINVFSILSCVLLVVGYKTRFSASFLAISLVLQNIVSNSYWRYNTWNPERDLLRFEHFQVLSIVGGLILLVKLGAGRLSIDEKRKIY